MKTGAIGLMALSVVSFSQLYAQTIDWQKAVSLSCAQIKLDGKRLNKVRFAVYKAANESSSCCDSLPKIYEARTSTFGHFAVPAERLQVGERYYLVFHAQRAEVKVPVTMFSNAKQNCELRDHVFKAKSDGSVELETWITVD